MGVGVGVSVGVGLGDSVAVGVAVGLGVCVGVWVGTIIDGNGCGGGTSSPPENSVHAATTARPATATTASHDHQRCRPAAWSAPSVGGTGSVMQHRLSGAYALAHRFATIEH